MLLAPAVGGSGPAAGAKRPVLSIAQVPEWLRSDLIDRSDRTGQALIPPRRFTQAAELLTGRGARVDDGRDDYSQKIAQHLRPVKPLGYNPELLASSRIRSLVELDAAFDRWRTLPSSKSVKNAVKDLVDLRKSEFASSAAKQDSAAEATALLLRANPYSDGHERTVVVWRTNGTPNQSTLVQISNPGNAHRLNSYWEAWNKSNAAEKRVLGLSELLRDQIKSGRVDTRALIRAGALIREPSGFGPGFRMFGMP